MRIGAFKRLLQGMAAIENEVSAEKGDFSLFALIEKDDWPSEGSSWRLFVAAPWIWADESAAWEDMSERVQPLQDDMGFFSPPLSISVVRANSPHLEEVWEYCSTEDGMVEVYNVEILDVTALRGYIFASRRPAEMPQPQPQTAASV